MSAALYAFLTRAALSRVCFCVWGGESAATCALVFSLNQKETKHPYHQLKAGRLTEKAIYSRGSLLG